MKIRAFQLGENLDLGCIKEVFTAKILYHDTDSILYKNDGDKYIYLFKFGAVCFGGYTSDEITNYISIISKSCSKTISNKLSDEYEIEIKDDDNEIGYDKVRISKLDNDTIALVMLNLAQSVTLDHYLQQTESLLSEIQKYAYELNDFGKIKISRKKLVKFIGKSLILKNIISENLYIFDTPPKAWENESLNTLNDELKKSFLLESRTRSIQDDIGIIKENLDFFINFLNDRRMFMLEYIILALMIIEFLRIFF